SLFRPPSRQNLLISMVTVRPKILALTAWSSVEPVHFTSTLLRAVLSVSHSIAFLCFLAPHLHDPPLPRQLPPSSCRLLCSGSPYARFFFARPSSRSWLCFV